MSFTTGHVSKLLPSSGKTNLQRAIILVTAVAGIAPTAHATIAFTDVSTAAGLTYSGESYGASWGDLNGDGYPDLFANNHRKLVALYLNKGDGTFVDTSRQVRNWVFRPTADTHGGTWADVDNDGDQDLFVSLGRNPNGTVQQFLINERGKLINRTAEWNIEATNWGGRTPIWFDGNNDGRMDFMMAQYGHIGEVLEQTNSSVFVNTTVANRFNCFKYQYGQLIDLTNDGLPELLCSGEATFPLKAYDTTTRPYTDVTARIPPVDQVADAVMADFDNDLRKDVFYVRGTLRPSSAVQHGTNVIEALLQGGVKGFDFRSTGVLNVQLDWNRADEGTGFPRIKIGAGEIQPPAIPFTLDPADSAVVGEPTSSVAEYPLIHVWYDPATATWSFRHLNGQVSGAGGAGFSNGYFIVTSATAITDLQTKGLWSSDKPMPSQVMMNEASGWVERSAAMGLNAPVQCASGVAGDFDNDMDVDLYLACRNGAANLPNVLFENNGAGVFAAVVNAGGAIGPIGASIGAQAGTADSVVSADYDGDGFLDLFVVNGFNMRPIGAGGPDKLFRNNGNGNHWIEIDLEGTGTTTRDAVGARVLATANGVTQYREQDFGFHRWSQNHKRLHFGLASATQVNLTVQWPDSTTETFENVAANQIIRITKGTGITPVTLGAALPYPCGVPSYTAGADNALVMWKDCVQTSSLWRVRIMAGGVTTQQRYTGSLSSTLGFTQVARVSLETADVVNTSGNRVTFDVQTNRANVDGMNITLPNGSGTCFNANLPAGAQVLFGLLRKPVTPPFDLETLQPCVPL